CPVPLQFNEDFKYILLPTALVAGVPLVGLVLNITRQYVILFRLKHWSPNTIYMIKPGGVRHPPTSSHCPSWSTTMRIRTCGPFSEPFCKDHPLSSSTLISTAASSSSAASAFIASLGVLPPSAVHAVGSVPGGARLVSVAVLVIVIVFRSFISDHGRCPTGRCPHRRLPPQDAAPQDAAPQEAAPQDAAPQDTAHTTLLAEQFGVVEDSRSSCDTEVPRSSSSPEPGMLGILSAMTPLPRNSSITFLIYSSVISFLFFVVSLPGGAGRQLVDGAEAYGVPTPSEGSTSQRSKKKSVEDDRHRPAELHACFLPFHLTRRLGTTAAATCRSAAACWRDPASPTRSPGRWPSSTAASTPSSTSWLGQGFRRSMTQKRPEGPEEGGSEISLDHV
ncbi:hypothetical protein NFI96_026764, partial [Prochilodus magdalenae]